MIYKFKEQNVLLKRERNLSFEQIISHIEIGDLLDIVEHPNKEKFAHQKILIEYIISVPSSTVNIDNVNTILL